MREVEGVRKPAERGVVLGDEDYEERMNRLWPGLIRAPEPLPEETVVGRKEGRGAFEQEVEIAPQGCLFKVDHKAINGYFDKYGFWCHVLPGKKNVKVHRGAPRFVMQSLTKEQKRVLDLARKRAIKAGIR